MKTWLRLMVLVSALASAHCNSDDTDDSGPPEPMETVPRSVKVLITTTSADEAAPWVEGLALDQALAVPGLSPDYPQIHCNTDDVCLLTTGMGHANAAASLTALVYSGKLDLEQAYFLVAGIGAIDPGQGTIGSVAWARFLVDYGIAWELDARELPEGWKYGYFGINTKGPEEKPPLDYRTEIFRVNEALLQKALELSEDAALEDSAEAEAFRANYPTVPANEPPKVIQCDTATSDTWLAGNALGERARDWVRLMTDGAGTYCTSQQEDNATYEVLKRATVAGKLDVERLAVLRGGAAFDRPYPGQSSADNLLDWTEQGGLAPALQNLYNAGIPLVDAIVGDWATWAGGVPE